MLWACLLLLPALANSGHLDVPTKEIAPGVFMPVLSIGTGGLEASRASGIVKAWLGLGGRAVDTAWVYRNQLAVATAIKEASVDRKDIFITSKIPGCTNAEGYVRDDLHQLNTSYIDLLLIHTPRSGDCAATWTKLEELHHQGVLRAIGVSNFKPGDLKTILETAWVVPAVNQIEFNVLEHDDETEAFSKASNITIEAYSPLGRSGHSGDIPGNAVIQKIADAHSVSTYQVALKWLLQRGHLVTFQSASQLHQEQDADVFDFNLTAAEMSELDTLQPQQAKKTAEPLTGDRGEGVAMSVLV